ncbi:hypothetical protein B7463_g11540, partial [Scytalidium lignicola]
MALQNTEDTILAYYYWVSAVLYGNNTSKTMVLTIGKITELLKRDLKLLVVFALYLPFSLVSYSPFLLTTQATSSTLPAAKRLRTMTELIDIEDFIEV